MGALGYLYCGVWHWRAHPRAHSGNLCCTRWGSMPARPRAEGLQRSCMPNPIAYSLPDCKPLTGTHRDSLRDSDNGSHTIPHTHANLWPHTGTHHAATDSRRYRL